MPHSTDAQAPKVTKHRSPLVPSGTFNGWGSEDIMRSRTTVTDFHSLLSTSHQSPPPTPGLFQNKLSQSTSPYMWEATRLVPGPMDYSEVLKSSPVKGLKQSSVVAGSDKCPTDFVNISDDYVNSSLSLN